MLSYKNIQTFLAEYEKLCVEWWITIKLSCMVMLQSGVFENLLGKIIINASTPKWSIWEETALDVHLMLWNTRVYCRMACFPQMKSCYLNRNDQMLFFSKLQRQPRTSPSSSCFGLFPISWPVRCDLKMLKDQYL